MALFSHSKNTLTALSALMGAIWFMDASAQTAQPGEVPAAAPRAPLSGGPIGSGFVAQAQRVSQILVEGNERIESSTVLSYMTLAPGDNYSSERVDESLKALFATGLFADVSIRREGASLIVRVVENPIVNRIAFEGNRRLNDDDLKREVQLNPRQVFTRAKVQADLQRLLQLYRRSGLFAANVEPKVITLPQNRVDVVFEIEEGSPTRVETIRFIGNERFSDSRLREEVSTRESAWYRFFSTADTYDPDRLNFDRELLRRFYLSRGYADFRVLSATSELSPTRDAFFITFAIEEGEQYEFGEVNLSVNLRGVDAEALKQQIQDIIEPGETYNANLVERATQLISNVVGRQGFAFVDVRPELNKNAETRVIGINFVVGEGARAYVERINITGNTRTLDRVIRREFEFAEGDAFNTEKLQQARTDIRGLNFFNKVDISQEQGSAPDRVVVNVEVEEKSTGELNIGAGYSTVDSILGDISIRERNFLGRGQDVRLGLTVSPRRQQFDFSFTEPYFLERDLSAGVDAFSRRLDFSERSNYQLRSDGGALRFGFPWSENLRQDVYYRLRRDNIYNVGSFASRSIREQEGVSTTSSVGYGLTYDRRDDKLEPTSGYILRLGQEVAGLGGTERFFKTTASGTYFYSPFEDIVLGLSGEAGHIAAFNDQVGISNRFFLGGDTFRGFEVRGIGPRDRADNSALGGNVYYVSTLEAEFPVGFPAEYGVKGRVFGIAGSLFGLDRKTATVQDVSSLRASAGAGISWRSPFGPIKVDVAVPVLREEFDRDQLFFFSFGTSF